MELILDTKSVRRTAAMLNPELVRKSLPRAINKAANKGHTAESKEIRKVYNITAKRLNKELEKVTGPNRAVASNPRAIIRAKKLEKRNPGLQHFKARQVKAGVSYLIEKVGKRKTIRGAFISKSHKMQGIFVRHGAKRIATKGRYMGQLRQPVVRKTGPSVWQMMRKVGIAPIKKTVDSNFSRLFFHEYSRDLARIK